MRPIAYRVAKISSLAPTIVSVILEPLNPTEPLRYRPTQYVNVSIDNRPTFPCSIANPPNHAGIIEFHFRTHAPLSFALGSTIFLEGPYGDWKRDPHRPCLLLAGGTGIAPFLSLMPPRPLLPEAEVKLYWGVRTPEDLYIKPQGVEFHPIISGWVHEAAISDLSGWQVFASGPLEMVQKAFVAFIQHGLEPKDFYSDMMR